MGTSASMVPEGCSRHAPRLQGGQVPALASRARSPCLESKSAPQDLPLVGDPVAPSRQPILQVATSRRIGRRSPMANLRTRKRRRLLRRRTAPSPCYNPGCGVNKERRPACSARPKMAIGLWSKTLLGCPAADRNGVDENGRAGAWRRRTDPLSPLRPMPVAPVGVPEVGGEWPHFAVT